MIFTLVNMYFGTLDFKQQLAA